MKRIFSVRAATGVFAKVAIFGAVVITLNTAPMSLDPVGGSSLAVAKENKHKPKPGKKPKHDVSKGFYRPGEGPQPRLCGEGAGVQDDNVTRDCRCDLRL